MSYITAPLAFWLLPLTIGWGVAMANGNGAQSVPEGRATTLPACEIRVDQRGDSIVLEGLVSGRGDLSGSYHLQVRQNGLGSSNISQSGDFKVRAAGSLGIVSIARSAGSYFATLTVSWDDGTADCVAQAPKSRKVKFFDEKSVLPGASDPPQAPAPPVQPKRGALDAAVSE